MKHVIWLGSLKQTQQLIDSLADLNESGGDVSHWFGLYPDSALIPNVYLFLGRVSQDVSQRDLVLGEHQQDLQG